LLVIVDMRAGINSLIILGGWTIWRHRNDCVFNGASPSMAIALVFSRDEAQLWSIASLSSLGEWVTSFAVRSFALSGLWQW
jgi:hypothetical protein